MSAQALLSVIAPTAPTPSKGATDAGASGFQGLLTAMLDAQAANDGAAPTENGEAKAVAGSGPAGALIALPPPSEAATEVIEVDSSSTAVVAPDADHGGEPPSPLASGPVVASQEPSATVGSEAAGVQAATKGRKAVLARPLVAPGPTSSEPEETTLKTAASLGIAVVEPSAVAPDGAAQKPAVEAVAEEPTVAIDDAGAIPQVPVPGTTTPTTPMTPTVDDDLAPGARLGARTSAAPLPALVAPPEAEPAAAQAEPAPAPRTPEAADLPKSSFAPTSRANDHVLAKAREAVEATRHASPTPFRPSSETAAPAPTAKPATVGAAPEPGPVPGLPHAPDANAAPERAPAPAPLRALAGSAAPTGSAPVLAPTESGPTPRAPAVDLAPVDPSVAAPEKTRTADIAAPGTLAPLEAPAGDPDASLMPGITATPAGGHVQAVEAAAPQISHAAIDALSQIAAQVARRLEGRSTRFEMALHPEDLGRVDVKLDIDSDGRLTARLAFDNPLAATDLRGRADELRRQLEQSGFQLSDNALDFAERDSSSSAFDRGREGRGGQDRAFASASRLNAETDIAAQPPRWTALSLSPSGVDLKV